VQQCEVSLCQFASILFPQVPEIYAKMSPFMNADKATRPILLVHGEDDNNPGTFPLQSERFYAVSFWGGRNCFPSFRTMQACLQTFISSGEHWLRQSMHDPESTEHLILLW
jgi:hypothetical protein